MKKYLEILRRCTLFDEIADENLLAMLGCLNAKVVRYHKKETVIAEGEAAKVIGIVLSGGVQIMQMDYFGNRSILSTAYPSELFGESFACAQVQSIPVSVVASENSEILLIDCQRVIAQCSNACEFHRQIIYNLMKNMAIKNIHVQKKLEIASKRTTRDKLMTYLLLQAKAAGRNRFDIPYDRQALADYLGVDRSGLSAEISKLQKAGVLNSRKNHFELLQAEL